MSGSKLGSSIGVGVNDGLSGLKGTRICGSGGKIGSEKSDMVFIFIFSYSCPDLPNGILLFKMFKTPLCLLCKCPTALFISR